jgi:Polycystin cation channel
MLNKVFIDKHFRTERETEMSFRAVTSISEFWEFADTVLLDGFHNDGHQRYKERKEDSSTILFENLLMGGVRIRQLRVRNDSCIVPDMFKHLFNDCYDFYSSSSEDHRSFGLNIGTAWTYHTSKELDGFITWAKFQFYPGGGFYQDLTESLDKNRLLLHELHDNGWIHRGTRVVFIEFTIYNPNINLLCTSKLVVEVLPTGSVITSTKFQALKIRKLFSFFDYFILMIETLFVIQILLYSWLEGRQMSQMRRRYFYNFWNFVDILIILIAYFNIGVSIYQMVHIAEKLEDSNKHPKEFINFDVISFWQFMFVDALGISTFLIWIRMLKYIKFNKTMVQFGKTLAKCAKDLLGFGFMFLIVFVAYAQLGFVLFGTDISDFRSFHDSIFTLMRTILGDFDYLAIERANRVLGPIYFLSYIFFVFFVLLNMFLAIINDCYSEVKSSDAQEVLPLGKFIKEKIKKVVKRKRPEKETSQTNAAQEDKREVEQNPGNFKNQTKDQVPTEKHHIESECLNCKVNTEKLER